MGGGVCIVHREARRDHHERENGGFQLSDEGYDESAIKTTIANLDRESKTAFAAVSAEYLWPLVERYAATAAVPDEAITELRRGLDSTWARVAGQEVDLGAVETLAESMVPSEEDDNWTFEWAYAENAIAAIAYAARTWLTDDPQEGVWAARQMYDASDYSAQQRVDSDSFTPEVESQLRNAAEVKAAFDLIASALVSVQAGDLEGLRDPAREAAPAFVRLFA